MLTEVGAPQACKGEIMSILLIEFGAERVETPITFASCCTPQKKAVEHAGRAYHERLHGLNRAEKQPENAPVGRLFIAKFTS